MVTQSLPYENKSLLTGRGRGATKWEWGASKVSPYTKKKRGGGQKKGQ